MVIGNNIQLTCHSAEGSPSPQYSWKSYNAQNQQRPLTQPGEGAAGRPCIPHNGALDCVGLLERQRLTNQSY